MGFSTPKTVWHLGLELASNMMTMLEETLHKIDPKTIKQ
jgi:hypothetical protein